MKEDTAVVDGPGAPASLALEPAPANTVPPAASRLRVLWRVVRRNKVAALGGLILLIWVIIALSAPLWVPYDPITSIDPLNQLTPPDHTHLFGTDAVGRDVFSRVMYGARISLPIGFGVIIAASIIGCLSGAISGYIGGRFDEVAMRVADVALAFPSIVLAIAITAALGPSLRNAMIAMVVVWWPEYARVMRGQVLAVRSHEYVQAARAMGCSSWRILWRHIIPNCQGPVLVKATLDVGNAILLAAALGFLGLGAVEPTPEWGKMVAAGRDTFYYWWVATFPALAIFTVVMGLNFLGDGLRDAVDPHLRRTEADGDRGGKRQVWVRWAGTGAEVLSALQG